MKMFIRPLLAVVLSLFAGGCATIVKDDNQPVAFSSDPQGAIISLNGVPRGTTPVTIMVPRTRKKQMIEVSKEGYQTAQLPLEKHIAAMTFGNIIFGGIIGLGVDYASGKGANYQEAVTIKLLPLPQHLMAQTAPAASGGAAPTATRIVANNGLGLTVAVEDKKLVVKAVLPDSGATAAGILVGDEIMAFSDESNAEKAEAVMAAINTPKGKAAVITWRSGAGQPVTARLTW